ncbi:MFS transporter [Salisediminibacterium selenitireducens]|uniref:Major facilitator superfamily MFS_1 n=1 Tax=Bacillus selenitireducens (strain ATCC 700615 / DSM 15326 / MLS10) TaxID=439292 RepID=D6XYD3_BACIE|nr:MFS transporter [Salisediminibacterium selenitireducens]ADI00202.1 major facilitator superfamily MFS_1 [[Bacillus] selenitireducens MLS10]
MATERAFLRDRNFQIIMAGVFIQAAAGGIYLITGMLLVIQLTGSVLYSGFAFFAISSANVLAFLIAPLANYTGYKRGLMMSNLIKALLLLVIPIAYATTGLNVWVVIGILFLTSLINQFAYPIVSTLVPKVVGDEQIVEANAYLQTVREAMDIVFIAAAGILAALIGSVTAIGITAVLVLLTVICYLFLDIADLEESAGTDHRFYRHLKNYATDLTGGVTYIRQSLIPKMMMSIVFVNVTMAVMLTNVPAFSLMKANGLEAAYGFYMAALSLGILLGTILSPKVKTVPFGRLIIVTFAMTGLLWIGTALAPWVLSMILFSIGAISIGFLNILIFSSVQRQVESVYIGRVVTLLTSSASLGVPVGALIGGVIGEAYSPVVPILIAGIGMVVFSLLWMKQAILRTLPAIENVRLFPEQKQEAGSDAAQV